MQDSNDLHFSVPPEQREEKLKQVQQTSIFLQFIEERPFEEQKLLFAEIERILNEGMPMSEYLETGFKDAEISWTDYRKIATLCFVETLMDFVEENIERTEDLQRNDAFNEAYETALDEIILFLENKRDDFPRETVRCLFLLTDGDIDPHRQGVTMTWLVLHCFAFCKTDEQKTEIERLIKECMI